MPSTFKYHLLTTIPFICAFAVDAQVLIHSHNDYLRDRPFHEAVAAKVFSVEADVFCTDSLLLVAHTEGEIRKTNSLERLYLEPLTRYCMEKQAGTSAEKYLPVILIDIKNDPGRAMPLLLSKLGMMEQQLKKEGIDTMPLFVISGNRPPADSFPVFPSYIQFDGRPYEQYDSSALSKVAFISDQYLKYSSWIADVEIPLPDSATITRLVQTVHGKGKKLRLWNTPDAPRAWSTLNRLGVDIINTDQPLKCRAYFRQAKREPTK